MKILLINPPQTFFLGSRTVAASIPLGLICVAAVLDRAGYEVQIMDALTADFPSQKEGETVQVGAPWEEIGRQINWSKPDIIGISTPFSTQVDNAIKVAQIARQVNQEGLIVVGGPHVSIRPIEFLQDAPEVDIAVIGEGEYTMHEIVGHYTESKKIGDIKSIAYREDGQIIKTPQRAFISNLDELPLPAYHLVNMEHYLNPKRIRYRETRFLREIPMVTSRGCPFNCVFCSIHLHMGKKWRAHSPEYVLSHIEYVVNKYGIQHIHFEDDNLTLNTKRLAEIVDGVIDRGIKFTWDTPNGVRVEGLTSDLLERMKQSGCTGLTIGVESGDQSVLDNVIDKHLRLEDVIRTAEMCNKVGIKLAAFFVIGFPGEKKENMERTTDFALMLKKKYGVDMELFVATPLWGTRLYEICRSSGYLTQDLNPRTLSQSVQTWGKGLIETEDFTPEEVKKLAARTVSTHNRLRLLSYLKHPLLPTKMALTYPQDAVRFVKSIFSR